MPRASHAPSQVRYRHGRTPPTRCRDGPAIAHVSAHTRSGEGEDNVSMQLVMAMQADGEASSRPRAAAGDTTSRPASPEPPSPRAVQHPFPWQRIFPTSFDTSRPSGLWRWQPWVPGMLGAGGWPSPAPVPLGGVGQW